MCVRYQGLELGPQIAEVKQMCGGVTKNNTPPKNTIKTTTGLYAN